jgi:cyclopropane fatty-acyl-phospholipid synthase-like methyltransferase
MDSLNNLGQYDIEYAQCKCFWGKTPGKFVLLLKKYLNKGTILDLGAGEGKNSIYLSQKGFKVVAVECSKFAIENFKRLIDTKSISNLSIIQADVRTFHTCGYFDGIIAYGLLHCLPSLSDSINIVKKMKKWTVKGGINIIVTFTADKSIPTIQSYLNPCFIKKEELEEWYKDWDILELEEEIINEIHPTSNIEHQHSLVRVLARKP